MKNTDLKIDKENRCIDRSTPEGKMLDDALDTAERLKDTPMGNFMSQVLAYAEVSEVVDKTTDGEEKEAVMQQLHEEFNHSISGE